MGQHVVFLLLGLANGAAFAALAIGLVVAYRASGVINFATGATALVTAYTYAYLRGGELLLLVPGLPTTLDLGGDLGFLSACAIAVLLAGLLGLVSYIAVYRHLRTAPAVAKAVASVGVMVVLTGTLLERVGSRPVVTSAIFPRDAYEIGPSFVAGDRFWFAGTVVLLAVLLAVGYQRTRFGLRTRAAADSEKGAFVSGISPERIAAANWVLSSAVAGLAGILIAPIVPLVPAAYTLLIIPALAAAVVGGFRYLAPTVAAGLAIGMVQSEAAFLSSQHSWLPAAGLAEAVPLVVVVVVLVVRGRPLPSRGAVERPSLGKAPQPRRLAAPAVTGAVVGALAIVLTHGVWRSSLMTSMILAVVALSFVVVTGYAGQVSLAQLTLAGVAGFTMSSFTADLGIPFPLAPVAAALVATVVGVVVGLPAIRIRGLPVAVVTLALAVALESLWFRNSDFVTASGTDVVGPTLFGLDLRPGAGAEFPRLGFCFLVLTVLVAVALAVAVLRRSALGSAMLAVRANERSAAAAGIDVVRTKVTAFAVGAFVAGLGGALLAYKQGTVTFHAYEVLGGLALFATAYIAGITSVSGGVLAGVLAGGGIVARASEEWLGLIDWYPVITGVALVLTVVLHPEGIAGVAHGVLDRRRQSPAVEAEPVASPVGPQHERPRRPRDAGAGAPLLVLGDLTVRYGGVVAVDGVSLEVADGDIVGLIGPNGAGKTTLLDAISGLAPADGSITLAGQQLTVLKAHQRVRTGLGRTFQAIELWDDLTVWENIRLGAQRQRHSGIATARTAVELLGLSAVRDRPAGSLSQGQRQLVSVARAVAGRPRLLMLDEPAGGLDTSESRWLGERLQAVRAQGVTVVLVDHDIGLTFSLCDRIHVLDVGRLIASGTPSEIRRNPAVGAAYLGVGATTTSALDVTELETIR